MYNIKLGQVAILPPGPKRRKVKMTEQEIDSLFQELGYEKSESGNHLCTYTKCHEYNNIIKISFSYSIGSFPISKDNFAHYFIEERNLNNRIVSSYIDCQTHEAIHQKMLWLKSEYEKWADSNKL